jgi:hypothetical protein
LLPRNPAEGHQSWASQVSFENETVLVFALKEQDVAEYHYRLYRRLAEIVANSVVRRSEDRRIKRSSEKNSASVHGEVDDESWQAKQTLLRRQKNVKRESPLFDDYVRQSFIDTLTFISMGSAAISTSKLVHDSSPVAFSGDA